MLIECTLKYILLLLNGWESVENRVSVLQRYLS